MRASTSDWLLACILCVQACGSPLEPISIDIDEIQLPPSTQTLIFASRIEGRTEVVALDAVTGQGREDLPSVASFTDSAALDALLLAYDQTGEELGLDGFGALRPTTGDEPLGGQVPRVEQALYGRLVTLAQNGEWMPIEDAPPWLSAFESPAIARCRQFGGRVFRLDHDDPFASFLEEDSDSFIGFTSGLAVATSTVPRAYRITIDGPVEIQVPGLRSRLGGAQLFDAKWGSRGRIWIAAGRSGGGQGVLFMGDLINGFEEVLPARRPGPSTDQPPGEYGNYWIRWLDVVPRDEGDLVYTLTDQGSVQLYDEAQARWSTLFSDPRLTASPCSPDEAVPNQFCGSLFRSDGTLYAADPSGNGLIHRIDDDRVTTERVGEAIGPPPLLMSGPSGFGPIAARADVLSTSLYLREADGWRAITVPFRGQRPFASARFGDGAVISGNYGYLLELQARRVCPSRDGATGLDRVGRLIFSPSFGIASFGNEAYFDPERNRVAPYHEISELSILTWE